MNQVDEKLLSDYIDRFLNKYDRLLKGRFFRAKINTVLPQTGGTSFVCSVVINGTTSVATNAFLCVTPGYVPIVGDDVECVWRDLNKGYILWPVGGNLQSRWKGHYHATAGTVLGNGVFTKLTFTAKDSDPAGLWSTANSQLTIPSGGLGWWRCSARAENGGFTAGMLSTIAVYKNGVAFDRGVLYTASTVGGLNGSWYGSWDIPCLVGDVIDFRAYQNSGGNLTTNIGQTDYQWCSFSFESPGV